MIPLAACGVFPERKDVGAPELAPLWEAARQFDRGLYGFTPFPTVGDLLFESQSRRDYDAMLHVGSGVPQAPDPYRTIAFKRSGESWRWIGEQQSFVGPDQFDTVDGRSHERLTLTYEIEPGSGAPLNQLSVSYWGAVGMISTMGGGDLTVLPGILAGWGYSASAAALAQHLG